MSFNPDPSKQAQVIFTRKSKNVVPPTIFFNKKPIQQVPSQKMVLLTLDENTSKQLHLKLV